ncbi:hypothetical protein MT1_0427 [Pseudomonas sp. MT-1]|nr:hypothetical protein MT1_0427 [Pseudomonas sp. MT-1]
MKLEAIKNKAWLLQIILDVNPQQALSTSNLAFLQASQRLSTIALGKRLPFTICSAIAGCRDAGAVVGNSTLTVKRTDNESGTGYEMSFSLNNGNPKGCTGLQHAQRAGTAAQTQGRYQDVQAQSVATALGAGDSNISETASVRLSKA